MPIIDLHCDTIDRLYAEQSTLFNEQNARYKESLQCKYSLHCKQNLYCNDYHVDLNKLKASSYLAQWFAIFIDTKNTDKPLMELARDMYDYFMHQISLNKDSIQLATSFREYEKIKEMHKIAAFLSLEEGQIIEGNLDNIRELWNLGVRMMTLTWNYENELAAPHDSNRGLTLFGREVVDYLRNLPMLLDISHLSETSVKEIAALYQKPILASHCNAKSVYSHTRNLSDDVIRLIADSGGGMGINLYSLFLNGSHESTIKAICEHIAYIYKLGGEEIISFGTDFDGINCNLEVCHAGEMGKLIDALDKIYPQSFIDKLTHKNAERILKENLA